MGKPNFTEDLKRDALLQITERGYPVTEVAATGDRQVLAMRLEEAVREAGRSPR